MVFVLTKNNLLQFLNRNFIFFLKRCRSFLSIFRLIFSSSFSTKMWLDKRMSISLFSSFSSSKKCFFHDNRVPFSPESLNSCHNPLPLSSHLRRNHAVKVLRLINHQALSFSLLRGLSKLLASKPCMNRLA